ncbi:hypothetical protein FOCC_FOCC013123 [Frankliniella occidentalis]|nr:hypothetical protein FOCC_FOCC013123 [Frankliniella occidentalis]
MDPAAFKTLFWSFGCACVGAKFLWFVFSCDMGKPAPRKKTHFRNKKRLTLRKNARRAESLKRLQQNQVAQPEQNAVEEIVVKIEVASSDEGEEQIKQEDDESTAVSSETTPPLTPEQVPLCFHDYALPFPVDKVSDETSDGVEPPPSMPVCGTEEISALLLEVKKKIDSLLPRFWTSFPEDDGLSCILMSRVRPRAAQRNVFFHYSGSVEISVHCQIISADNYVKNLPTVSLQPHCIDEFVDRALKIIGRVRLMEICAGGDRLQEFTSVWGYTSGGFIDRNPYNEARFVQTFRSNTCTVLINSKAWRCEKCHRINQIVKKQFLQSQKENLHVNTPDIFLNEQQKLKKLKTLRQDLDAAHKRIRALLNPEHKP